jgi:DNA-binding CsgD family transcriptional regulator
MNIHEKHAAHSAPVGRCHPYALRHSAMRDSRADAEARRNAMQVSLLEHAPRPIDWTASAPAQDNAALRQHATAQIEPVLGALLDELDYGVVLLLRDGGRVVYVNHAARTELRGGHLVDVVDGALHTRRDADAQALGEGLAAAQRGLRRLVTLGAEDTRASVALIPIGSPLPGGPALVAAVFGRRRLCEQMSVQWFARAHGLTPAESRVLELLCDGLDPRDIATVNEVGMATVRTQVNSIRDKTGAGSIRALLQRLAMLPPMVSSLRC